MKIIYSGLILLFVSLGSIAQTNKKPQFIVVAKVDERIELTSIVARLAGYEEYVQNGFKLYADKVDDHFAKYKNHAAVEFAKEVRERNSIGFDAIPNLAVSLHPAPLLTPRFVFNNEVPDKRWGKTDAEKFARLLKQFYIDADCETFFKQHADTYRIAEERFQQVLDKVDFNWYQKFYGEVPRGSFNLYLGLLNGGMNFGPRVVLPGGREEFFSIMGTQATDTDGLPKYSDGALPTIIHEFNHSFINHLIAERRTNFEVSGAKVFPLVKDRMKNLAYGDWETTVKESLVRAAVIRYLFEHPVEKLALKEGRPEDFPYQAIDAENRKGFYWTSDLVTLLGTYENARKAYPTFRSFMPIIEAYFSELPKRIDNKIENFERQRPN